jgi:hypothetical protein
MSAAPNVREKLSADWPTRTIEGVVSSVSVGFESNTQVLRFVVQPDDGNAVPVEMRGEQLRGVLTDGHRVAIEVSGSGHPQRDPTLHPTELRNRTTNALVVMWRPGRIKRSLRWLGPSQVVPAVVAALVGAAVAAGWGTLVKTQSSETPSPHSSPCPTTGCPAPPLTLSGSTTPAGLIIAVVVGALVTALVFLRVRHRRRVRAILLGVGIGFTTVGMLAVLLTR